MTMPNPSQYSDTVLNEMQLLYGDGYLSPGGAEEVGAILDGVTVHGRHVLDLGCGVGGAAIRIVGEFGASSVLGIDVEAPVLERAEAAVKAVGLDRRISFQLVTPGPFPLADESVDVVFSKDVVCQVPDKEQLFAEVARVLRKGGVFAFGDWTTGAAFGPNTVQRADGLVLHFEPLEHYLQGLEQSGFAPAVTREHSAWLLERTRRELETVEGMRSKHENSERMRQRIEVTQRRLQSLQTGRLEHWHLQATRAS